MSAPLQIYLGWDSREEVAASVATHSIRRRTHSNVDIRYLKHRELRKSGNFARPWMIEGSTGDFVDLIDNRPFSTEFSHTRFLVPCLMKYKGWALFADSDMLFLSDIKKLFALCDDQFAVMCVKHNHQPPAKLKMDGREQLRYFRKNWSSFVLWNCAHSANRILTPEKVSFMRGGDLHSFSWLHDYEIGSLPMTYNYISGVSPKLVVPGTPDVIHYTEGGPWFDTCKDVPYAELWTDEYEHMQANGAVISSVPTVAHEEQEVRRK